MQDDIQTQAPVAVDPTVVPVVSAPVVETPVVEMPVSAPVQVGPEPVVMPVEEVKTDVKVVLPEVPSMVPAMETPVEAPVMPTPIQSEPTV